jgi:hypothetical protein
MQESPPGKRRRWSSSCIVPVYVVSNRNDREPERLRSLRGAAEMAVFPANLSVGS